MEIDVSKLTSSLHSYALSFSCQTLDGSNRDYDLTAARVLSAIAESIENATRVDMVEVR